MPPARRLPVLLWLHCPGPATPGPRPGPPHSGLPTQPLPGCLSQAAAAAAPQPPLRLFQSCPGPPSCPQPPPRWCPWSPLPQAQTGSSRVARGLSPGSASGGASTTSPRGLAQRRGGWGNVVRGQRLQGCRGAGEMLVRKPWFWGAAGRSRQGSSHWGGSWGVPPNPLSPKKLSPHVSLSCKQLKCCCLLRPREVSGPHDTHSGLGGGVLGGVRWGGPLPPSQPAPKPGLPSCFLFSGAAQKPEKKAALSR